MLFILTDPCLLDSSCLGYYCAQSETLERKAVRHFLSSLCFLIPTLSETSCRPIKKQMYLSASGCCCCFCPCTHLRPMYSGLRWRSLERKLRSCLREAEGRGAEVWGGGSGARGARGQAVAGKGRRAAPFFQEEEEGASATEEGF